MPPSKQPDNNDLAKKNRQVLIGLALILLIMISLVAFSVPLYNLFCRVTGYGGTTQITTEEPDTIIDRDITVSISTRIKDGLPWDFQAEVHTVKLKVGQVALANFIAQSHASQPTKGTAIYNVTPAKVGKYFHKTQCFCFEEQLINPGETANFPVRFFVDPSIMKEPTLDDVTHISLTYTFYPTDSQAIEGAMDDFYNRPEEAYTTHITQ